MPKRTDLEKILIIGSGPIVIGQACEFDYSGSQACKALKQEGYTIILINSNPATIMTDPEMADKTYIEPIKVNIIEKIIAKEKPDALLPTLGGQTGLNIASTLHQNGVLKKYNVELIGANFEAIQKTEDRELFKNVMSSIGVGVLKSAHVTTVDAAVNFAEQVGYPLIIRPSFTLGGSGGGIAYNIDELKDIASNGISQSPSNQILIEESVIGWKEYELELMRDKNDNVVIVCSIENLDPMGVHTGDSITVAPVQTLSDKEYQEMRDEALKIIREVGVETGGSNIQFAVNPGNGRRVVVEMNPRVSRSSALASKATGFAIAKIAAKLAVGYTLDELPNEITYETPACFEPAIDYCVTKIPRWDFDKFPGVKNELTTQMKSVGEVMGIGRTFKESLQKALRSLEQGRHGWGADGKDVYSYEELISLDSSKEKAIIDDIKSKLLIPNNERIFYLRYALIIGLDIDTLYEYTGIDKWFLYNLKQILELEIKLRKSNSLNNVDQDLLYQAKQYGFSDKQLAFIFGEDEKTIREYRENESIKAVFKLVDTCAGEFKAYTPYYYSTYEVEDESLRTEKNKVMILGGGPNRIGQGIEFDYCCVQAAYALKEQDKEVIMVNCNPETVSTDYDTSDKLYFEPITLEDVLNICQKEQPDGVILQFGGQTPLKLAFALEKAGINVLGTSPTSIDLSEDREKFSEIIKKLNLKQPPNGIGYSYQEAKIIADNISYPVLVRPSYVLGGRAMEVVYDDSSLENYMNKAVDVSPEQPVLIDKFLEGAVEVDVDAIADGEDCIIGGIMEHIEMAGVHSGDSACALPPYSLSDEIIEKIKKQTKSLAQELNVLGLLNIQFAVKDKEIYILEVNPRASRTIPFVSKTIGKSLAKLATRVMLGGKLKDLGLTEYQKTNYIAVKEAVFPFIKFPGVDIILGPEMKSTGEVMGIDDNFGMAFAKAQMGAGLSLPLSGNVLITVNDHHKNDVLPIARRFKEQGFSLIATRGTAEFLQKNELSVEMIYKIGEGRPDILDYMKNNDVQFLINSPEGKGAIYDEVKMRRQALLKNIPHATTIQGAQATIEGIEQMKAKKISVKSLQEYHV
ncbi:MAG: carbamoyl-phosphate synthase large subunit [Firmicutes bacterium]|nr:carbamoyl-phosphate synthase large subunit [Bacillota bacterium]